MRENNIEITLKNFNKNPDYVHELCELGGLSQVPALSIDGKILYESEDIIAFLKDLKEKGAFNDS